MPLQIVRNDITKMKVDAIVNAANESLLGGGGVDGSIHQAAGPELLAECRTLHGCRPGEAKITGAYRLPCQYVIHTVGPRWHGGLQRERETLVSCYRSALSLAQEHGCESAAFPLISSGAFGYPKDQALRVAVDTIGEFLLHHDMTVYLVVFDRKSYQISSRLFSDIAACIDDQYVARQPYRRPNRGDDEPRIQYSLRDERDASEERIRNWLGEADGASYTSLIQSRMKRKPLSLDDALKQLDESFSEMLLRKIRESGMTDAACYKKANIDRKLFSKIKNDKHYQPSKSTAIAFCLALELPMGEMRDLLSKAGYAMTHASKFDIIVEYFVRRGNYNVFEINEALFAFDQNLIGA